MNIARAITAEDREKHLNNSNLVNNSWFTGFTESDGHFGIVYKEKN